MEMHESNALMRRLGVGGPLVSALGLGCMGMSDSYGAANRDESIATIRQALASGISLIDTADVYGDGDNERLVGRAVRGRRHDAFIATKFGLVRSPDSRSIAIEGRPSYVRSACEASLRRLGIDCIDLYYQHRVSHDVPIEDTVGAMGELVSQGKVRYLGLSEANPESIRRASATHLIAGVQSEWSLWSRDIERDIVPACRELGIAIVPYSPIGRGFLTCQLAGLEDLEANDIRLRQPRFEPSSFKKNFDLARALEHFAASRDCSPSQVALAWLRHQGDDVIPIPGTRKTAHLAENVESLRMSLSAAELSEIESIFPIGIATGQRYADMTFVDR
jgi:aryl-alcohol dehydrogenase-like predicted oxidoreductase